MVIFLVWKLKDNQKGLIPKIGTSPNFLFP